MDEMEQGPAQQIRRGCQGKVTCEVQDGGEAVGVALANQKNGHEADKQRAQYFGLMGGAGLRNRRRDLGVAAGGSMYMLGVIKGKRYTRVCG